ncbi:MAG: endonuclease [Candidatus Zixiibacteriota bacterium]
MSPQDVSKNRYTLIVEKLFFDNYSEGASSIEFTRDEIEAIAKRLKIKLPKNLGDIIYSFRYRSNLPASILKKAPKGWEWIIRGTGRARYEFKLNRIVHVRPDPNRAETKIPDATPAIVVKYALNDEQSLLAKLRYNRLIDIFLGITCYSLQSHLRTSVASIGQVETDEMYVGVDRSGVHYIVPVQAKGRSDRIGVVQIEQDCELCAAKYPALVCKPVAAQYVQEDLIAVFLFEMTVDGLRVSTERQYRLVAANELSEDELKSYRDRLAND